MKSELSKISKYEIAPSGHFCLDAIKKVWGTYQGKKKKTVLVIEEVDGEDVEVMKFEEVDVIIDSPMKRINGNYPQTTFYEFASKVEAEDEERIQDLISRDIFDVGVANKSFSTMTIAMDKKVKPKSWSDAYDFDMPSINTVAIYKGEDYVRDTLFAMLLKFSKKFGKRSDLDTDQMHELADEFIVNYRMFTIVDFKYMFHHLEKSSKKLFSLDYQIMLQLVEDGLTDKEEYFINETLKSHEYIKKSEQRGEEIKLKRESEGDIESQMQQIEIMLDERKVSESDRGKPIKKMKKTAIKNTNHRKRLAKKEK